MATSNPLGIISLGQKKEPAGQAAREQVASTAEEEFFEQDSGAGEPLFSVVKGSPSAEELAALTAVLVALQQGQDVDRATAMQQWQRMLNRGQRLGVRLRPGPGSWRRAQPM